MMTKEVLLDQKKSLLLALHQIAIKKDLPSSARMLQLEEKHKQINAIERCLQFLEETAVGASK